MFEQIISEIKPLNNEAMEKCQLRLDNLSKPLGSLHSFEHLVRQLAGITGNARPYILPKSIIIMAKGDALKDTLAVNIFAEHVGAHVGVIDIDMLTPGLNTAAGKKVTDAIQAGIAAANQEIAKGVKVIGIGCSGPDSYSGGKTIIAQYNFYGEKCGIDSQLAILRQTKCLEIAGVVGVILGAAAGRAAVVLDGLATTAAALIAVNIVPGVKDYLIGSHLAIDPAHQTALTLLKLPAYLEFDMPGDDGIGAALGMSLINASLHVINDMKTFGEADVAIAQDGPGASRQNKDVRD